jgi:hypothetical protein
MGIRQKLAAASVLGLCVIISACGTTPVREEIPSGFQSGTEILGVVTRLYSRDEVLQNKRPLLTADLREDLLASGIPETDIQDGSEMEVVTYCYAWNSQVGCKNIRGYMAHASPDLRDQIKVNSVVAVKLDMNKENRLMGSVVRVYGQFKDPALSCEFIYLNYKGLSSFSPYGPPVAQWFECKGIGDDGWVKKCAPDAPWGGPISGQTCVFELQKPPQNK